MNYQQKSGQIVFTNKARCRDCYRCIRVCPVKAIRMEDDQAFVVEERCIACGTCIRECPQHAKAFRNDLERAKTIVQSGARVAVSLAPSFAGVWPGWQRKRLVAALRKLGFMYVAETAIGAAPVAHETARQSKNDHTLISTACPAVVNYIEMYKPELATSLAPVASPMIAHARWIRQQLGDKTMVIFIGPCVAKKAEIERHDLSGEVNCAITFEELQTWLRQENILMDQLEESDFDEQPAGYAQLFPLSGGLFKTAELPVDNLNLDILSINGFDELHEALKVVDEKDAPVIIDPLFCTYGCIDGPAIASEQSVFQRKMNVIKHAEKHDAEMPAIQNLQIDICPHPIEQTEYNDATIRNILAETGQVTDEDMLNCTACGYSTCRDRAIAVLDGMAEPEMCIPYMRRLAEQRSDLILETSPNGIVVLDDKMKIIKMNPAFRKMFRCSEATLGKRISYLMDPSPFEKLAVSDASLIDDIFEHEKYNLVTHQVMYKLGVENQLVGIFVNITKRQESIEKLQKLRQQTLVQAQELMEHQIDMAQKIAEYMGQSTARGEVLVDHLIRLAKDEQLDAKR